MADHPTIARLQTGARDVWQSCANRPTSASFLLGLIAALGYPPIHLWWLAIAALAAFVALLYEAATWRAAVWRGWLFGWAHLTLANNWIATAFTHQAKMPEFLGWVAVPLLCVYLAAYPALAALCAHALTRRWGQQEAGIGAFALCLAGSWIVFEWVRGWAFTGYPWPPLGLILLGGWDTPGLARVLPWLGTYALSGLVVLFAGAIPAGLKEGKLWPPLIPVAILAFNMYTPTAPLQESDIRFTLVQPLISQDEINDGSKFEEQFARIAGLTVPGSNRSRVVFWPESAIPDYLEDGYPQIFYDRMTARNPRTLQGDPEFARQRLGSVIGSNSTLLTGVINLDIDVVEGRRNAVSARNSVIALRGDGEITHSYAKAHLVPYGEYLPMRPILEPLGLSRLVAGTIDYKPGSGPRTLDLGKHGQAGVQICYEIVFSGRVVDRGQRPDYIFNPSNDGWFGSWGPPQHLAQARMRALEEGLPVLRSTTTGISAVIDARGIVRQSIGMGEAAALEGVVPAAGTPTLFSRVGNALPLGWAAMTLILGLGVPRLLALRRTRS
ncbi:MAG: apolipoprotein N-acyltransferase [Erythrobacter sp.]|uniref:apolipoprotein N-acyltransferase n=1 Tax=Erythrobacter sp. TaxID=1042 RepID=UPI002613C699|nr:apolipoprotein N-acyltransferase [Erythrobacter sp.]MDJ0979451.1 apolipoprotein N-acyltransferase [Erythrobacter sp.]